MDGVQKMLILLNVQSIFPNPFVLQCVPHVIACFPKIDTLRCRNAIDSRDAVLVSSSDRSAALQFPLVVVAVNVATIATATDFATTTQPYVVAVVVVILWTSFVVVVVVGFFMQHRE